MNPRLYICSEHWEMLCELASHYGLVSFKTEEDVSNIIEKVMSDGLHDELDDFDPLLMMDFHVWKNALKMFGVNHMTSLTDNGGKRCPLCEYENHNDETSSPWVNEALTVTLSEARHLGLIPVIQ